MRSDQSHLHVKPDTPLPGEPSRATSGRRFRRHAALSTRLAAIFLVAALPALALAFWTAREAREQRTDAVRQQTARLANLVAAEHRRIMDTSRGVLVAVAHLPQVIDGQVAPCSQALAHILDYYKVYSNFGVSDLEGNVICSARPASVPRLNVDRPFFTKVMRNREFTVGEYQFNRATNTSSISFAHPVTDASGEPTAIAIAALDLSVLEELADLTLTRLPMGSAITLMDHKGTVIARKPDGAQAIGLPFSDGRLLARMMTGETGTERGESAEGPVLHAFSPVRNPLRVDEWYTLLTIPEEELYGPLGRSFRDSLLVLGVVLIIVLAMGWLVAERLVLRPASRILEATRHMASGDLGVRIGPDYSAGELGELARSFDDMAEALDQRKYELDDNQERLAAMSRRLIAAQEDERRRIARELHDELGQLLTGAKLNLVSLQGGMALPHDGFDPLDDTLDLVGRALTTVRELSTELRPAILDEAGLAEALHWLLHRVALRAGFEARFDSEPVGALPPEVETTLFRFAQEALTNVMRHAAASHVSIALERRGSTLHLTVRDDGVGFYADAARARSLHGGSLGLIGMEERITLAGGHLEIDSLPGRGTTLHATVPVGGKIEEDWEKAAAS